MPPLVTIIGETGSGKSDLTVRLAQRFNGEIISADSWAVYKEFTIGTAKPSTAEQASVQHHLIDVAEPLEGFSAVQFQRLAKQAIADIAERGHTPFLVGGTGLYVDSVLFDYGFLPPTDPALRAELNTLALAEVLQRAQYLGLDMTDIDVRNKRRVIRLIENEGKRPTRQSLRQNTLIIGIPSSRADLQARIEKRVDSMLSTGLEQEVRQLADKYGWGIEALKGVGYYQWKSYFEGTQSFEETRAKIITATLDLAKRQRTWFKRNKSIHWLTTEDRFTESVDLVTTFLDNLH